MEKLEYDAIGLNALLAAVNSEMARREAELDKAFRDPDKLRHQIIIDAANVIAAVGGYAAPVTPRERQMWIAEKMLNDSTFVAKAHVVANLIKEYAARRR